MERLQTTQSPYHYRFVSGPRRCSFPVAALFVWDGPVEAFRPEIIGKLKEEPMLPRERFSMEVARATVPMLPQEYAYS
jgi:hypothetical protein